METLIQQCVNAVIAIVFHLIRQILADNEPATHVRLQQQASQPAIAIIGKIDMPGTLLSRIIRGEAVDREQCCRLALLLAAIEQLRDRRMIGMEERPSPRLDLFG